MEADPGPEGLASAVAVAFEDAEVAGDGWIHLVREPDGAISCEVVKP